MIFESFYFLKDEILFPISLPNAFELKRDANDRLPPFYTTHIWPHTQRSKPPSSSAAQPPHPPLPSSCPSCPSPAGNASRFTGVALASYHQLLNAEVKKAENVLKVLMAPPWDKNLPGDYAELAPRSGRDHASGTWADLVCVVHLQGPGNLRTGPAPCSLLGLAPTNLCGPHTHACDTHSTHTRMHVGGATPGMPQPGHTHPYRIL